MGSTIGPAFNYLLGGGLQTALTAVDATAQVIDSLPVDRSTAHQFVIGCGSPGADETAAQGMDALTVLGAGRVDEDYEIPCYIQCFTGGTNQAQVRNAALTMWNAFVSFLATDRTLGGALTTAAQAGWAEITQIHISGTPLENAEAGRFCVITFNIRCRSKYYP